MPRTKLDAYNQRHGKLAVLIAGNISVQKRSIDEISRILRVKDPRTARKCIENPESIPLNTLLKLCRGLHVPIDEVRSAISY
jgi:hypothetical protein